MKRLSALKITLAFILVTMLALTVSGAGFAASTVKTLSTNFTLVNLGSDPATGTIEYYKDDGTPWAVDTANTKFSLAPNGGQVQIRQYFDSTMSTGKGSVVVNSSQQLGAVVQILARGQTPTSGAYKGFSDADVSTKFYVPIVASRGNSSSGTVNSQIIVQNASLTTLSDITIDLISLAGTLDYTKHIPSLAQGVSYYYDLADETNLPPGWFGSAVVTASDKITVVNNLFLGPDALQSFNAFPQGSITTDWLVPSFFSRLTNGLSAVVTVQNLSGSTISAHTLILNCKKDVNSGGQASISVDNPSNILDKASYNFNAVTDARFPANWYGSCSISAPGGVVVIVQLRYVGAPNNNGAAGYEAIPDGGTDKTMFVPLIAKRLSNGFATVVTIQNLNTSNSTTVTLNYVPSSTECPVTICDINHDGSVGSDDEITISNVSISAGGSIMRNHRLSSGPNSEVALPDGWVGSLQVVSASQPINGFVQLTNYINTTGDTFMAHDVFTQP
jgi:hypothetical protein